MKLKTFLSFIFFISIIIPANCQQEDQIKNIAGKLDKGETTISNILSDPSLMSLHSITAFREMIKQHAKAEKIKLNTDKESGIKITVKGTVLDKEGKPLADKLVYVYQTSSQGWYSDTGAHILQNEGDRRHARLFGYFKTGSKGTFEFETVKPTGYPNSTLPGHIHIEITPADHGLISELQFDDDPRLVGDIRARSIFEKYFIVKNSGTKEQPVYIYNIQMPY